MIGPTESITASRSFLQSELSFTSAGDFISADNFLVKEIDRLKKAIIHYTITSDGKIFNPIEFCLFYGCPKALSRLVEVGVDIINSKKGFFPLHYACEHFWDPMETKGDFPKDLSTFKQKYSDNFDLFHPHFPIEEEDYKLLYFHAVDHETILKNKFEAITILLNCRADPNSKDPEGKTPLEIIEKGYIGEVIDDNLYTKNNDYLRTCIEHEWKLIHLFLNKGAYPKTRFTNGKRIDEILSYYLNQNIDCPLNLHMPCPLEKEEIEELKGMLFESLEHFSWDDVEHLIPLIYSTVRPIFFEKTLELQLTLKKIRTFIERHSKYEVKSLLRRPPEVSEIQEQKYLLDQLTQMKDDNPDPNLKENRRKEIKSIARFLASKYLIRQTNVYYERIQRLLFMQNHLRMHTKEFPRTLVKDLYKSIMYLNNYELTTSKCEFEKIPVINSLVKKFLNKKPGQETINKPVPDKEFPDDYSPLYDLGVCLPFEPYKDEYKIPKLDLDSLSENDLKEIKQIQSHLETEHLEGLCFEIQQILKYLDCQIDINKIDLNGENARIYLNKLKLVVQALEPLKDKNHPSFFPKRSSYELRTHILELCSPSMTTAEAYTYTLDPDKFNNRDYLKVAYHWIPGRVSLQKELIDRCLQSAISFSDRQCPSQETLWILKGNSASGKSYVLKNDSFFSSMQKNEIPIQSLNVDNIKLGLKKVHTVKKLTNAQVHNEGTALQAYILDQLNMSFHHARRIVGYRIFSGIIEGRFSKFSEITDLFCWANNISEIRILDIEVPLRINLYRILARDPCGEEPCLSSQDIVKGHLETTKYRAKMIESIQNVKKVKYYKLLYTDMRGSQTVVAEYRIGVFKSQEPDHLKTCCTPSSDEEVNELLSEIISKQSIVYMCKKELVNPEAANKLEQWIGYTLEEALDLNAMAISPKPTDLFYREKYGKICLEFFDGNLFSDYPHLIKHLHSEHLLHIRGLNKRGEGLHWSSGQFDWKEKQDFNPEKKVAGTERGGFQMKLGYFILPPDKVNKKTSKILSKEVLNELEVHEKGRLVGYRLFVHPEAYDHYKVLHDQKIPYIQSSFSEYIGTPTSSYRSWVVRKRSGVPFIVKMGVSRSKKDSKRLLPSDVVSKSVQLQQTFDEKNQSTQLSSGLWLFPETFGITIKNLDNYPPKYEVYDGQAVDSGMIIREFPKPLLENKCHIFSFSALMSLERIRPENRGICSITADEKFEELPLIFEIISKAIEKKKIEGTKEFVEKFFVDAFINAFQIPMIEEGLSFECHGQNLCVVFDNDYLPKGFAYRDFEGVNSVKTNLLASYSWFYRYHILFKLLAVLTKDIYVDNEVLCNNVSPEVRDERFYLKKNFLHHPTSFILICANERGIKETTHKVFQSLSIDFITNQKIRARSDHLYMKRIQRIFYLPKRLLLHKIKRNNLSQERMLVSIEPGLKENENYQNMEKEIVQWRKEARIKKVAAEVILLVVGLANAFFVWSLYLKFCRRVSTSF